MDRRVILFPLFAFFLPQCVRKLHRHHAEHTNYFIWNIIHHTLGGSCQFCFTFFIYIYFLLPLTTAFKTIPFYFVIFIIFTLFLLFFTDMTINNTFCSGKKSWQSYVFINNVNHVNHEGNILDLLSGCWIFNSMLEHRV